MLKLKLQQRLHQQQTNFLNRTLIANEAAADIFLQYQGKNYLSFVSNNYLGLANHPKVIQACQKAISQYGVGSGSAYLISGYKSIHQELEEHLADFLNYPKTLLFSCGYMANLAVMTTLFTHTNEILADKLIHASLIDGCLASKAVLRRYRHCDIQTLQCLLQQTPRNKAIVTEGLFSMDGTIAPLTDIYQLSQQHSATLIVDDAHGIGTLGLQGRGSLEKFALDSRHIPIITGSLGKAFGAYGGFIASDQVIIDSLVQFARTYTYTTAIPPAIAAAALASLQLFRTEAWRRQSLQVLVNYFQKSAAQLQLPILPSSTAIQIIKIGDNQKAINISQQLWQDGIFVAAIRPPTVPKATARLRISLTANHTRHHIDQLLEGLSRAISTC